MIVKNRTFIIAGLAAVFAVITALIVVTAVSDGKRESAYEKIDSLIEKWNGEKNAGSDTLSAAEDGILADLEKIASA